MDLSLNGWPLNLASLGLFVCVFAGYHAWMWGVVAPRNPLGTSRGANRIMREQFWEHALSQRDKSTILVIQSLRNFQTAATFLASTALVISSTAAGYAGPLKGDVPQMTQFRLLVLAVTAFCAFFSYSQTVRFSIQLVFLFQAPACPKALLIGQYFRAQTCYTIGNRCLYTVGPLVVWNIGAVWMLALTAAMLPCLWLLDRTDMAEARYSTADALEAPDAPHPTGAESAALVGGP